MAALALATVMCRSYDQQLGFVTYQNGWSCQTYTDYFGSGFGVETGHECRVVCANGTASPPRCVQNPLEPEHVDPGAVCSGLQPSATQPTRPPATATPASSRTESARTGLPSATATRTATPAPVVPLLTEQMTSCSNNNQLGWWGNFRLAEPRLDPGGRDLQVTLADAVAPCGINQEPATVTYPAPVVVRVDGTEVNRFEVNMSDSICAGPTPTRVTGNQPTPVPQSISATEPPPTEPGSTPGG